MEECLFKEKIDYNREIVKEREEEEKKTDRSAITIDLENTETGSR